jgi:hypothetical protein
VENMPVGGKVFLHGTTATLARSNHKRMGLKAEGSVTDTMSSGGTSPWELFGKYVDISV